MRAVQDARRSAAGRDRESNREGLARPVHQEVRGGEDEINAPSERTWNETLDSTLFDAQRDDRLDLRCRACGDVACDERHCREQRCRERESERVVRLQTEEQCRRGTAAGQRQDEPHRNANRLTGSVRSRMASMTWKIAVFAPMPNARDRIATSVNPGLRRSS